MNVLKSLVVALSVAVMVLFTNCLNPIGLSDDFKLNLDVKADVAGEISIDNINSAEVQFVNHTKSMDITKIEIYRSRINDDPGQTLPLDARLLGGPHAGVQESILLRPIGTNYNASVVTNGYQIRIQYGPATHPEQLTQDQLTQLNQTPGESVVQFGRGFNMTGDFEFLPRGKTTLHMYRDKNTGSIKIEPHNPDSDSSDYFDYIVNVKGGSTTNIDLGNLELGINIQNPIQIAFSAEVQQAINDLHIKLQDLVDAVKGISGSINSQTQAIAGLGDIMNQMVLNGNNGVVPNHSLIIVQNHTSMTVESNFVNDSVFTGSVLDPAQGIQIAPGNQDYLVLKNGGWRSTFGQTNKLNKTVQVIVPQQKFLHIYKQKSGNYNAVVSTNDWLAARPGDAMIEYGFAVVLNESNATINKLYFMRQGLDVNQIGINNQQQGALPDITPRGSSSSIGMGYDVELGNYLLFAEVNGKALFQVNNPKGARSFSIDVPAGTSSINKYTNSVTITQADVDEAIGKPILITYQATANGGPTDDDRDTNNTTEMVLQFLTPPGSFTINKTSGQSIFGTPVAFGNDGTQFKVPVDAKKAENVTFTITGTNVDPAPHTVTIFFSTPVGSGFVPVENVIITNYEGFTKNKTKTLQWKVSPENATNQVGYWDIGDASLLMYQLMGSTPPMHLGTAKYGTKDTEGRITVDSSWTKDWVRVAYVIPNGIALGERHPGLTVYQNPSITQNGKTIEADSQSLIVDPKTDFVKIFTLTSPDKDDETVVVTPPAAINYNIILNYVGRSGGSTSHYENGKWAVEAVEIVERPPALVDHKTGGVAYSVSDSGRPGWSHGDISKGKASIWWQPNPMDERDKDFGGTSEGWIKGNFGGPWNVSSGTVSGISQYSKVSGVHDAWHSSDYKRGALAEIPVPDTHIGAVDVSKNGTNMAFAYWATGVGNPYNASGKTKGTYNEYADNFYGSVAPYHRATLYLNKDISQSKFSNGADSSRFAFSWIKSLDGDNVLNSKGEQVGILVPNDGKTYFIRLRMAHADATVGFWWKAVGLQEWFAYRDSAAPKQSNGKIVIDVDLYGSPYMTYRK